MNSALRYKTLNPPQSCDACAFLDVCGGWDDERRQQGCFQRCSRCVDDPCDCTCPNNLILFDRSIEEVQGFCTPPRSMNGPSSTSGAWSAYLPMVYHGAGRRHQLTESWVAVPLHAVCNFGSKSGIDLKFESREELCAALRLPPAANILLTSVCPDPYIEAFWTDWKRKKLLEKLARWDLIGMTTPNYSITLDTPRTNALWNITRIFRMIERIGEHGIPVVPHFNASTSSDWRKWTGVMRSFPDVNHVCMELQTGLGNSNQGKIARDRYLAHFADMQATCSGRLHPIVLAGAGIIDFLASNCSGFTIVDANPFMKTHKRKRLMKAQSRWIWHHAPTAPDDDLSDLFQYNIMMQRQWLFAKHGLNTQGKPMQPTLLPAA